MIIDSPVILDICLGTDRRIPEIGDAQVLVPPVLQIIAPATRPTRTNAGITPVTESSIANNSRTNNNQAASADSIMTLVPGLYEIEVFAAVIFDYTQGFGAADDGLRVTLDYLNVTPPLICIFAAVGSFNAYAKYRVLLTASTPIVHRMGVTGLADNARSRVNVNVARYI